MKNVSDKLKVLEEILDMPVDPVAKERDMRYAMFEDE
jgi:hypothetical protein